MCSAEEYYNKAEALYKQGSFSKMIPLYEQAANLGHLQSMHCLGYSYTYGEGVETDYNKAFAWYSKAADKGYEKSIYAVGNAVFKGLGVKEDKKEGFELMKLAAQQGYPLAAFTVGKLYIEGVDVVKREKVGMDYICKAALAGSKKACNYLEERFGNISIGEDFADTLDSEYLRFELEEGNYYSGIELAELYWDYGFLTQYEKVLKIIENSALQEFNLDAAQCLVSYYKEKSKVLYIDKFLLKLFEGLSEADAMDKVSNFMFLEQEEMDKYNKKIDYFKSVFNNIVECNGNLEEIVLLYRRHF